MRVALVAAAMACASPAAAHFFSGDDLHAWCQRSPAQALAFVAGVYDGQEADRVMVKSDSGVERPARMCIPTGTAVEKLRDIVCIALDKRPDDRRFAAASIVTVYLSAVYPCR